jgi:hypothetical protein
MIRDDHLPDAARGKAPALPLVGACTSPARDKIAASRTIKLKPEPDSTRLAGGGRAGDGDREAWNSLLVAVLARTDLEARSMNRGR